jgi:hypothetical protein
MMPDVEVSRASELIRSSLFNSTLLECYMGGLSCFPLNLPIHSHRTRHVHNFIPIHHPCIWFALFTLARDQWIIYRGTVTRPARQGNHSVLMGFIVLLFVCYMIELGCDWQTVDSAYVKHATTADSTIEFLANPPLVISGLVPELFRILALFIADGILVRGLQPKLLPFLFIC